MNCVNVEFEVSETVSVSSISSCYDDRSFRKPIGMADNPRRILRMPSPRELN
jgi:hypothetical protein